MKKKKPIIFIQDTGVYGDEMLVAVGSTKEQIVKWAKKVKAKKGFIKWISEDEGMYSVFDANQACFAHTDEYALLLLKEYNDDWKYWEILLHEVSHIVHHISGKKRLTEEDEAKAYLTDYLFSKIRRKIQGIEKI